MLIRHKNSLARILLVTGIQLVLLNTALADCAIPSECPKPAQVEELTRNLDLYHEAMSSAQYDEAEVLAKRVMEFSILVNGLESIHSAHALTNLALVQQRQKQYDPARLNFEAAIRSIEQVDGPLSSDLIEPLQGLGETALAINEINGARQLFQRAVHISHVNDGPQNPAQIESLEAIAETYLAAGEVKGSLDILTSIYSLKARDLGLGNEEFIPALQHYAEWMTRLRLHNRAKTAQRQILRLQEAHLDDDDVEMIPTLIALAITPNNYRKVPWDTRYHGMVTGPDHYLNRAMRIAAAQPESEWEIAADTRIAVGDYFTLAGRFSRARYAYTRAWKGMSRQEDGLIARQEKLGSPSRLEEPYLPEFYHKQTPIFPPSNTDDFLTGTITAEFDLASSGRTININVVESQPSGLAMIEERLARALEDTMHRPRMEDGSMVETSRLTYRYEFYYQD